MSALNHRVRNIGSGMSRAMGQYHPAVTAATPVVMPAWSVIWHPAQGYPWGTAVYQDLNPVWAADGALISAFDSAGIPRNVRPAGRASPAHQ